MFALQEKLASLWSVVRLNSFDVTSPEGRSKERLRRVALTSLSAAFARVVMMATPLVSVPLMLGLLGTERFGMWMTIASTISMLAFADLGLGNGLIAKVAHAHGRDDREGAARYVSSAFFLLLGVAVLALAALALTYHLIPWAGLFNVTSADAQAEAGPAMAVYFVGFAISLPLSIVQKVQTGYQEGFQSNLWQCATSLLALSLVITTVYARGSLPMLVLAICGSQFLVLTANCAFFYGRSKPWLWPRWSHFDAAKARALLHVGLGFFLTSGLMAIGLSVDNLVAAQRLSAEDVTQLAIPARMAVFLTAVPLMLYTPFWGANAEALARGETDWVWRNMLRLLRLSLVLTVLATVVFVVAGPWFIHWWVGPEVSASVALMLALGLASVGFSVAGPIFMVLNAAGVIYPQIIIYGLFTLVCVALKIWWAGIWGVTGIAWATVVCYPLLVVLPAWLLLPRALARFRRDGPTREDSR